MWEICQVEGFEEIELEKTVSQRVLLYFVYNYYIKSAIDV